MQNQAENQYFFLPEMPAVPGLRFRRFQGLSDLHQMLAVLHGSKQHDSYEKLPSLEELENNFANMKNSDPYRDMLFPEVEGRVIGFSRVWWVEETSGERIYFSFGHLLPEWRGKGIGTAMLLANEQRLCLIAAGHPPELPKRLRAYAEDTEVEYNRLLLKQGYTPERYFLQMSRPTREPIPDAPMPPGLAVRPVGPEHYRLVFDAMEEAFRDHWGYTEKDEVDFRRWLENPHFEPGLWKVAWDGNRIAGMVLNFINHQENREFDRQRGYTEDISVRRAYRKRGLAKALIAQSILMFRQMGMQETALGVDAENLSGALDLYTSMGYAVSKKISVYRKQMDCEHDAERTGEEAHKNGHAKA